MTINRLGVLSTIVLFPVLLHAGTDETEKKTKRKRVHTRSDPALVSSSPDEDRGKSRWLVTATIQVQPAKGKTRGKTVETWYRCGNPSSRGTILNPSWDVTVAKLQIKRSHDVCEALCEYFGKKAGKESMTFKLDPNENYAPPSCSSPPQLTSRSAYFLDGPKGKGNACVGSENERRLEFFYKGVNAGEKRVLAKYMETRNCQAASVSQASRAPAGDLPVIEVSTLEEEWRGGSEIAR